MLGYDGDCIIAVAKLKRIPANRTALIRRLEKVRQQRGTRVRTE